jgi:hypothetical protein
MIRIFNVTWLPITKPIRCTSKDWPGVYKKGATYNGPVHLTIELGHVRASPPKSYKGQYPSFDWGTKHIDEF